MKEGEKSIPQYFICPISLEVFKDPVTLCTGQTYDRSSIQKWFSYGHLTCPITMQNLSDLTMVPNHTLLHLINQWLHSIPIHSSLSSLEHNLHFQSHDANVETLEKFQSFSQDSLVQLGFLPLLLEYLFGSEMSPKSIHFADESLSCIRKLLGVGQNHYLNILKQESKLESFRLLLQQGNTNVKEGLCYLIEVISTSQETRELGFLLCENSRFLASLFLISEEDTQVSDLGIKAISALCLLGSRRENLVQSGVLDVLLAYISTPERNLAPKAMAAIEVLLELERAKDVVINSPNGIDAIVKMVFRVSDHQGSESAMKSLMIICTNSLKAREESINRGVLTQLLLLLQSQCSGRTKTRAKLLLKLLRSKSNQQQQQPIRFSI